MFISFNYFSEPYEPKPVLYAALTVAKGYSAPMDLVRVETKSEVNSSSFIHYWRYIIKLITIFNFPLDFIFIFISWLGSCLRY